MVSNMKGQYVDCENVYKTTTFTKTLSLDEFMKNYVDIPKFEIYCSLCKNYNKSWECPPHRIDVEKYWKQFDKIKIIAVKLDFTDDFRSKSYTSDELNYIIKNTLYVERSKLKKTLINLEDELDGKYLYGGRCDICEKCAKRTDEPCRFPDLMRYSVESIGSNIQKLTPDIFDFSLKWIEKDMKIPEYLVNVCAVLY